MNRNSLSAPAAFLLVVLAVVLAQVSVHAEIHPVEIPTQLHFTHMMTHHDDAEAATDTEHTLATQDHRDVNATAHGDETAGEQHLEQHIEEHSDDLINAAEHVHELTSAAHQFSASECHQHTA